MPFVLTVENDGSLVLASNFWGSEYDRAGTFIVSTNAGAFRLLVPQSHEGSVIDMAAGKGVAVSRGPWPDAGLADAFEVLFDDGTSDAFALHLSPESFDRPPAAGDVAGEWAFTAWLAPLAGGGPRLALGRPCRYRLSERLPDLRPWGQP
jgi:hypothetical protein